MPATYDVSPLDSGAPFGAKVSGLTLAHLEDAGVRKALFELWIDRGVILFRGESTPQMHVALSRCFGILEQHPFPESREAEHPELVKVKFYPDDGTAYEVDGRAVGGWLPWHSDLVYTDTINRGGILRPIQLPQSGGLTGFIDQIAAYERLPQRLKDRIDDLNVVYVMDLNAEHMRFARPKSVRFLQGARSFDNIMRREYQYSRILHPMVYRQAETGRKVLNVSPWFATGIYEIGGPPGEALLAEVIEHCTDEANAYFHDWRMGDMLLWDNWRTLHCATGVPIDQTRVMQRTTISGDYALGRKLDRAEPDLPRVDV
jgi:taurine dioxygenase